MIAHSSNPCHVSGCEICGGQEKCYVPGCTICDKRLTARQAQPPYFVLPIDPVADAMVDKMLAVARVKLKVHSVSKPELCCGCDACEAE